MDKFYNECTEILEPRMLLKGKFKAILIVKLESKKSILFWNCMQIL